MASRKRKGEGFGQDGFPGKEGKRRKQNTARGRGPRSSAHTDPLERRRHRWRKQSERELELGLAAGIGISALDDDDLGGDEDMGAEPLDFEGDGHLGQDDAWQDGNLDDYDADSGQDEWE